MSSCKLVIKDEVNVKFENLSLEWRKRLSNKFKYEIPYARHLPAVKLGRWDGKVSFFGLGGTTYLNLVDQILPILDEGGVYVDFEDHRPQHNFEFKAVDKDYLAHITWPEHHPCAGQPIQLRDYQVEVINKFIENPQSIQEIATGAGKTIITAALCQLVEPYGRTLTIVPNKSLVTQTEEDFLACNLDVGVYYGDRKELGRFNTIATWQSLNVLEKKSKDEHTTDFLEAIKGINTVIIDEVHMAKADVLKRLLTGPFAHCGIRWGLTGTVPVSPQRMPQWANGPVSNLFNTSALAMCTSSMITVLIPFMASRKSVVCSSLLFFSNTFSDCHVAMVLNLPSSFLSP